MAKLPPPPKRLVDNKGGVYWQVRGSFGSEENRKQIKRKFDTQAEADELYAELIGQKRGGVTAMASKLTVEIACEAWLSGKRTRGTTANAYRYSLKPLRERYPDLLLIDLDKDHLDSLVNALLSGTAKRQDGTARRAWKPVTVNVMLRHIQAVLQSYVNQGKLVRNVAMLVDRVPGGQYKKFETYNKAEVELVLAEADRDRKGHAWHLALLGLRRGEIGGLRWGDIDFDAGTLAINPGHNRVSVYGTPEEGDPKTEHSVRELPLTPELRAVLKAAWKRHLEERMAAANLYDGTGGYVVCDEFGRPYHPDTLSDHWLALCRRAGVKRLRLHDARHTCATIMALQGVPPSVMALWMGHADASFTLRTYVRPDPEELRQAADALQAVMSRKATP